MNGYIIVPRYGPASICEPQKWSAYHLNFFQGRSGNFQNASDSARITVFKMASISMEIGFIMAAMKDRQPSTDIFAFRAPASHQNPAPNQKPHAPAKQTAKQTHSGEDERRCSTDSEFSLKGNIILPSPTHAARGARWSARRASNCAGELTRLSVI